MTSALLSAKSHETVADIMFFHYHARTRKTKDIKQDKVWAALEQCNPEVIISQIETFIYVVRTGRKKNKLSLD